MTGGQEQQRNIYTEGGNYREIRNQGTYVENYINLIINGGYQLRDSDTYSLSSTSRFFHYFKTLLFLVGIACVWSILGIFAQSAFPAHYAWSLLSDSLFGAEFGSKALWRVVKYEQNKLCEAEPEDLEPEAETPGQKAAQLNRVDSKYWVITKVIELLSQGNSEKKIAVLAATEALRLKRSSFSEELEKLKEEHYPKLTEAQNTWSRITNSQAEIDYRRLEQTLNLLVEEFASQSTYPSRAFVKEMLDELKKTLDSHSRKIAPSRLKSLYKIWYLLNWVSSQKDESSLSTVLEKFDKVISDTKSNKYHYKEFAEKCPALGHLLNKYNESKDSSILSSFLTTDEAERNSFKECGNCKRQRTKAQARLG